MDSKLLEDSDHVLPIWLLRTIRAKVSESLPRARNYIEHFGDTALCHLEDGP